MRIPATAANESCQPGSPQTRGFQSSGRGGEDEGVPARGGARRRHRGDARQSHRPGALKRRAGSRERDVQGDQGGQDDQPRPQTGARDHQQGQRQRGQQHHVLAADREQVCEAGVAPIVAGGLVDALVLAQHHAAQHGRAVGGHAGAHGSLSALAHAVEQAGKATAPVAGDAQVVEQQLAGHPAPAQVRVVVERRVARAGRPGRAARPQPAEAAAQRELVADRQRTRKGRPTGRPRQQMGSTQPAAGDLDLGGRAKGAWAWKAEQVCPQGDLLAVADAPGGPVDRGEAEVSGSGAGQDERGGGRGEPGSAQGGQQARTNGSDEEDRFGRGFGERETSAKSRERNVEGAPRDEGERAAAGRGGVSEAEWTHGPRAPAGSMGGAGRREQLFGPRQLTAAGPRAGSRTASRRFPRPRAAHPEIGSRRARCGTPRCAARASGRCRRVRPTVPR